MRLLFRKSSPIFIAYLMLFVYDYSVFGQDELVRSAKGAVGGEAVITCSVVPHNSTIEWYFNKKPVQPNDRIRVTNKTKEFNTKDADGNHLMYLQSKVHIGNGTALDAGEYLCRSISGDDVTEYPILLDLSFPAKLVKNTEGVVKRNVSEHGNVTLQCEFEVYNQTQVKWYKIDKENGIIDLESSTLKQIDFKRFETSHTFVIKRPEDNGTYVCEIQDPVTLTTVSGYTDVVVFASPKVVVDLVKAISASQLFLNWTVHAYNSPIKGYNLMYRKLPSTDFSLYTKEKIGVKNTSFVIEGLDNSTEYQIKLEVSTDFGSFSYVYQNLVKTLDADPVFVPNISINGFSATSVTIGWAPPSEDIAEYIHYYLLEARKKGKEDLKFAYHQRDSRNLPYMFERLEPHSTYIFRVCACSEFTKKCGNWSEEMEAATLDGVPGKPSNVTLNCYNAEGNTRHMNLTWEPPVNPNAEIKGYNVDVIGNCTFKDHFGGKKYETWGPKSKFVTDATRSVRLDDLKPNTNFTVRVCAKTRSRRCGEEEVRYCYSGPAPPENPPKPRWTKIVENGRYMFKMIIPRISERNGPICCYRVYMVRLLPQFDWSSLPSPREINVINYEDAHSAQPVLGAYITDVFSNEKFPQDSELIMGDEKSMFVNGVCSRCVQKPKRANVPVLPPKTTTSLPTTTKEDDYDDVVTSMDVEIDVNRERRSYNDNRLPGFLLKDGIDYSKNPMMMDSSVLGLEERVEPRDGKLDSKANYTMFVELIPGTDDDEPLYSEYLRVLMPAPSPPVPKPVNVLEIVLQVTCGILALVLIGMVIFCIMHTRKSRKMPPHAHVEMNPIQAAFRYVEQVLSGRGAGGERGEPPVLPPLSRAALAAGYLARQADSDYGFQKEFEMLPDCFPDRTSHASEARENQPKNRYPDIKAYDQTRVKLSQIDGIAGSDYINANYVMGYKERKQFICAQGPTDTTVNDFWRMIWEHGLELIVMLTNLEEYSKVKCSKYWPDELRGRKAFGDILVQHVSEQRYSDYIVRELKITKQPLNSEGQPIVENGGIKKNGDVKDNSNPTSPRSLTEHNGTAPAERRVKQYHFLMWKDFAAPEHAHTILKFIKRMNEAWSHAISPIVVHCSAGVGRTGTLVALDCLLDQLIAEDHVSVYNTVADLRRQRNFLVQSLKQYVFVYRALVEYAHFGDTEISAGRLKSAVDRLRNTPDTGDTCLMEHEFQKILNAPVAETVKSCSAGASEEVKNRNRSQDCLPYDRNRVILTPQPHKEYSTYINASFIEAYDNSEGYIITQDPLPNTIADFWRMVFELSVGTIVMLSEVGDGVGKCPRYWDDGTSQYDHISVQYDDSDSCPYYTRRQFTLTNNKNGESMSVRHLQYQGWPTSRGAVPEVTRGLADLADAAHDPYTSPILVHCHYGTERSSMFVALCILISQLRREKRVDINTVARKIRSQRAHTIDTFLQYEFLHRAILNYAELHNLMDDS